MQPPQRRVRLVAEGRVQGVFFRASVRDEARRLGLTGAARNLPDGRVEVELQGPTEAVERGMAFCRRGPGAAVVTRVDVDDVAVAEGEEGFVIG